MSTEITTAFINQFNSNVLHLSQQKGSRLRAFVRNESQASEKQFFDRVGLTSATKRTERHGDTKINDTPHSRRMVSIATFDNADLVDEPDKLRTLIDPTSEYALSFGWAFGRSMDDVIIEEAFGDAFGGKEGTTTVTFPNTQKLASVSGAAGARTNVQALRRVKKKMDEAEVDPSIRRYGALRAEQFDGLLAETEVTSSDFNTVKALVSGEINTFLGFQFIHSERTLIQSGALSFDTTLGTVGAGAGDADLYHRSIFWAMDGLLHSIGKDTVTRISERADKNHSTQVFTTMDIGGTRMEEVKVVELLGKPTE